MAQNTATDVEPATDISDERDAIFAELEGERVHVLTYYGSEPSVALVKRDKRPSTEHPNEGEKIVLVEWHDEDEYALSTARGEWGSGWELEEELVEFHETRDEALSAAERILDEE